MALMFSNVGLAEIGFEGGFQTWTRHPLPLVTTGQGIFANYPGFELSSCNRKHQRRKQLKNGHLLFLGGVHESLPDLMIDTKKTVFPCVSWGYPRRRKMAFRPMFLLQNGLLQKEK